ncbi:hypothetical protein [Amylibacter sp. IMCC11727]|uniref:hypothetical protein n=1 Tax=Amylibacter sp. IMCC11727 TaxID=3039851 RepID=UPI00244DD260|nr:hypothetical protein [Amylibacter sp. IMCC11727]WGI22820.1 hypothetical protein QBD29_05220 [Amylibacter sp. IMCC11727]
MVKRKVLVSCVFAAYTTLAVPAFAETVDEIINEFQRGELPIENSASSILLPFAWEWDAVSSKVVGRSNLAKGEAYHALSTSDEDWMKASIQALTSNDNAVDFFKTDETMEAFDKTYQTAVDIGSSVGGISREDALRYWILSRAVAAGPEVLSGLPQGEISVQWCLPPLIRCTPPKVLPKDE